MDRTKHFIKVDQFTINADRIDYIEHSDESTTIIHFSGGRTLELGEDSAKAFLHELDPVIGTRPSWPSQSG